MAIVVKDQAGAGEYVVHVAHEERGHAVQAKSAYSKLKLTTRDPEGRLMDVPLSDPELVIGGGEIELSKPARPPRIVNELLNVREGLNKTWP